MIIRFPKKAEGEERCSFCLKPKSEVKKLISNEGNDAICDECIKVCHKLCRS